MTQRHDLTVTEADHLSPMPTPHSRRGRRRGPKVVLVTLVLLLAPVLLLELFIRGLIAVDRLPVAPSNSEQLDVGVVQVLARPPQDVLLVGDSQMATGVDPAVLQKLLRRDLGERITVYNFGQPASTTESNRQVLDLLVSEGKKPRVIVMDISMSSLVNERFNLQNRPDGREPLVDGEGHPTLPASALGRLLEGCDGEDEIIDRLDCEIANASAAWRWHGRPERILRAAIQGARFDQKRGRGILRADGFFARIAATPERIQDQIRRGDFSLSRVHPAFNKPEADGFKRVLDWAEGEGIEVVLVGWPLTKPYTDELIKANPDWLADREAATKELEAYLDHPVVYIDTYGDWFGDTSASDLNHLDAEAAVHFTHQLWDTERFRSLLTSALGGTFVPSPDGSPAPGGSSVPLASAAPSVPATPAASLAAAPVVGASPAPSSGT